MAKKKVSKKQPEEAKAESNLLQTNVDTNPETPPAITINDIQTMIAVINVSSQRGGFVGNELKTVGELYTKLSNFLVWAEKSASQASEAE
jgi:hypothetical protein